VNDTPGWEISDDPETGDGPSGRTLTVPAGKAMQLSFQLSIADCSCVIAPGPYVTVYPATVIAGGKAQTGPDQFGETATLTPVPFRGGPGEPDRGQVFSRRHRTDLEHGERGAGRRSRPERIGLPSGLLEPDRPRHDVPWVWWSRDAGHLLIQ